MALSGCVATPGGFLVKVVFVCTTDNPLTISSAELE